MKTEQALARLENFGFTSQGAAIAAIWFSVYASSELIEMVLICNPCGIWKAYIGVIQISRAEFSGTPVARNEAWDAKHIAHSGSKLPYAIAKAAFPERPFDKFNYDCETDLDRLVEVDRKFRHYKGKIVTVLAVEKRNFSIMQGEVVEWSQEPYAIATDNILGGEPVIFYEEDNEMVWARPLRVFFEFVKGVRRFEPWQIDEVQVRG